MPVGKYCMMNDNLLTSSTNIMFDLRSLCYPIHTVRSLRDIECPMHTAFIIVDCVILCLRFQ